MNTNSMSAQPKTWSYWAVTVTPKVTTYAGSNTYGEQTVTVYARSRDEAIKDVRKARRDADGAYTVPASYRCTKIEKAQA